MKTKNVNESLVQDSIGKSENQFGYEEYTEKVFSKWMFLILGSITVIFSFIGAYEIMIGWQWTEPLPVWFWPVMALFFLVITINYFRLTIKIDHERLTVGYGVSKSKISWDNIEDCYLDETSSLWYGGWGSRLGRVDGKWRAVYNVIGGPRVVVSLKEGWIREVAFSTKDPEEVMEKIEYHSQKSD